MALPLVLITGATGYLGAHIVEKALEAGYAVRITVRSSRLEAAKAMFKNEVEIVVIDDLGEGDYTEALKGVGAVIHTASPTVLKSNGQDMYNNGLKGVQNILSQSEAAKVKKFVFTGSCSSVGEFMGPAYYVDKKLTDKDWNTFTEETILSPDADPFTQYAALKQLTEQNVWKFADTNPEMDITTIVPPFIYGPLSRFAIISNRMDLYTHSTFGIFYARLLNAPGKEDTLAKPQTPVPVSVDVRDCARAHILALSAPLSTEQGIGHKRILMQGPGFTWRDATEHLTVSHPELASQGRLKALGDSERLKDIKLISYDNSRLESILGWKEFTSWEKMVDDAIDSILAAEQYLGDFGNIASLKPISGI